MGKIATCVYLLLACAILSSGVLAESISRDEVNSGKLNHSLQYLFPQRLLDGKIQSIPGKILSKRILINPSTDSPGNLIGNTYCEFQSWGGLGRRIASGYPQNEYTHIIWLCQDDPVWFDFNAGFRYQVYHNGVYDYSIGGAVVSPQPFVANGSLTVLPDNRAVVASTWNKFLSPPFVSIEASPNFGIFSDYFLSPDTLAPWYSEDMIYNAKPALETHIGTDTVLYVLSGVYGSGFSDLGYILYRKVGDGEFDNGRFIESGLCISHTIVARQNTDSVAMVYSDYRLEGDDGDWWDLNVVYRLSTDQGLTWGPRANISQYTQDSLWRADSDYSALWDDNGDLHVVWNARDLSDSVSYWWLFKCRLLHWSTADERTSIIAEARYSAECYSNTYDMNAGKPSLSLCDGNLYVVWTQYNGTDVSNDCSESGYANGELFMAASDDNGLTWDTAVNLTNTRTPGCPPGDCESDVWPSMTRYGIEYMDAPDSMDIVYINDKDGGCIIPYEQGTWTVNNVMHFRFPCRDVVHIPRIAVEPADFDYPMMIEPDYTMDTSFTIVNIGNGLLNWEASIDFISGSEYNWLTLTPSSGAIDRPPNNTGTITLTFNSQDLPGDPSVWEAEVIISASDYPGVVDPSTIHVTLIVASDDIQPKVDTINNGCRSLIVYNTGQTGGDNPGYSLNIPGDCDTVDTYPISEIYLYDGSPVISYVNDTDDSVAYTAIFSQIFTDPVTFRPQGGFTKASEPDFDLIQYSAMTTDSIFGIDVTFIVPGDGSCFIFARNGYYLLDGVTEKTGVCLGLLYDWDIPSDTSVDNGSGYDESLNTIWQYGAEYHDDNQGICAINENDRLGGIIIISGTPKNAWTEDNWAHQEPPAYDQKFLYSQMSSLTGYDLYTPGYGQDPLIDLHTGITFAQADMTPGDTFTYLYCLVTTNQGSADYLDQVAMAYNWASGNLPEVCSPGDAQNDGTVNIADAVYLISYIFKGGPAPAPYEICSGDSDGDCRCNVGDAVYIITYIFKGGPAPVEYFDWYLTCGSPAK